MKKCHISKIRYTLSVVDTILNKYSRLLLVNSKRLTTENYIVSSNMKLFIVFCILVTIAYVRAERDEREVSGDTSEWIQGTLTHDGNDDMTGAVVAREAHGRQRRNVCQRNWFLRMLYGDNSACKVNCLNDKSNGTTWRGGMCLNRRNYTD
ncbi:uncharacterized protein LOC144475179 isoform X2 [Augochlora pura]